MTVDSKAAESRREYLREWRRKNPQKVREYNIAYWTRRAEREARQNAETSRAE